MFHSRRRNCLRISGAMFQLLYYYHCYSSLRIENLITLEYSPKSKAFMQICIKISVINCIHQSIPSKDNRYFHFPSYAQELVSHQLQFGSSKIRKTNAHLFNISLRANFGFQQKSNQVPSVTGLLCILPNTCDQPSAVCSAACSHIYSYAYWEWKSFKQRWYYICLKYFCIFNNGVSKIPPFVMFVNSLFSSLYFCVYFYLLFL